MAVAVKDRKNMYEKEQKELFAILDKGINNMKSGRTGKPSYQEKQNIGYK